MRTENKTRLIINKESLTIARHKKRIEDTEQDTFKHRGKNSNNSMSYRKILGFFAFVDNVHSVNR